MVCTFGDVLDVTWWRDLRLATSRVIGADGRLVHTPPNSIQSKRGKDLYKQIAGKSLPAAKEIILNALKEEGLLTSPPEKIVRPVKFFEKGNKPIEIILTRQWYIKNGSNDQLLKSSLVASADQLNFFPKHIKSRYLDWILNLSVDWLASRQRFLEFLCLCGMR